MTLAALFCCPRGFAADAIWTADATTGYLWSDAANWSTNAVPTGADAVILPTVIPEGGAAGEITLGADEEAVSVRFRNRYALLLGDLFVPALYADMGLTGTIGSQLTGSGGLAKTGGGAIRLANAASDFTGTTSISNGSIIISSGGALGTSTSTVVVSGSQNRGGGGGSLVLDGTAGGFTLSRNVSLQGYGPISDRGAALVSVGDNTLSGSVGVAPATVNTRLISATGTLTFAGTFTANSVIGSTISMLGGTNQAGVGNYAITGTLAGTGMLEKQGAGMLLLNPSSSSGFFGNVRISQSATGGTQSSVRIISDGVLGTNTLATSGSNVLDLNGGLLEVRMNSPVVTAGGAAANSYLRASSSLFVDHAPGGTAVNGTLVLGQQYFEDGQTLTLNGRNGYGITFGAAPVNGGENNSTITNNLGGTLTYTGAFWSNTNNDANRTMTIGGNGNTLISGNITASAAAFNHNLTKTGSGSLTITSAGSTLDGNVNINDGAIAITDFRSITNNAETINIGTGGTAGTLIIGTATAATAAGLTTSKAINLAGTTGTARIFANQAGGNPVVLNGIFTAGAGAKTLTLGGTNTAGNVVNSAIPNNSGTNTTALTKFGPGTWILSGANTYTGTTTISNGTLMLQADAPAVTVLPTGNAVAFFNTNSYAGGTLEFRGQAATANTLSLGTLTASAQGANRILLTPGAGGSVGLTFANVTTAGTATLDIVGGGASASVAFTLMNGNNTGNALAGRTFFWNGGTYAFRETTTGLLRAPVYGVDAGTNVAAAGAATLSVTGGNYDVTGDITAQTTTSIATMRMAGDRTVTLGSGQTLTLTGAGVLATGGSSTITGGTLAVGSQALVVRANLAADVLTIASTITGSNGLTKSGAGTLVLSGANTRTGTVELAEGTIRLSGSGTLSGANVTTNIRQAGTLDLGGVGTGTAIGEFNNIGTVTNSSATPATLTVGNSNGGGTSRGVIQDGTGRVSVTKLGTGNTNWLGDSTYTGPTTIGSTGLVTVDRLADIGQASGIGAGDATSDATNAASLVFNGTTGGIVYQGSIVEGGLVTLGSRSASTNRLFTLAGTAAGSGATLSSTASNNNAVVWSNPGAIAFGSGAAAQTLTLTGASSADNTLFPQLTDNGGNRTAVTKTGTGLWALAGSNNTYTGVTTVSNGTLALAGAGALPAGSPLVLGTTTTSGLLQASGTFTRPLAASATAGTGSVTWGGTTGGGGFAAHGEKLVVAIGGLATPTPLTWGVGGFVGTGGSQQLLLSSATSLAETEFRNPINLNGAVRTVNVGSNGNTAGEFASLTGAISGSGSSGLTKTGNGVLVLGGANTYAGTTNIEQGTVVVRSLGRSGSAGATSVGDQAAGNTNAGALVLGNASTTGGILQYVGPGETSDRKIRLRGTTAGSQIHADGAGPLILTNVAHDTTETGSKTLSLRGTNTEGNTIASNLSNNGAGVLSVTVDGNATWILSGSNTYSGETNVNAGALGLGSDTVFSGGSPSTLALGNGSVFAAGGDRTIGSPVRLKNNETVAVIGDHSLTFTSAFAVSAGGNNVALTNSLAPGAALNLGAVTANDMTGNRTWTIQGPGATNISGNITTTTSNGLNITKTGSGTLSLGGTGGSNFNQNNAAIDLDNGRLRFTASAAIGSGTGYGNLTFSPEASEGDVATLDLNGTTQTINGLTATSAGAVVIDNSSAGNAMLSFGGNDQAVTVGGAFGSYTITDSGAGRLSLRKTGTAAGTITAATLTYTGATEVTGGTLTIGSRANGTNALLVTGGSLIMSGGLASPAAVAGVTVAGGSMLNLADGVGGRLANLTTLSLGATGSGTATLALDISAGATDTLTLLAGNAPALGNSVTFNINDAGAAAGQTYTLLDVAGGGLTAFGAANLIQGVTPTGFSSATWNVTDTSVSLSLGSLLTGNAYWTGGTNTVWNAGVGNWSQNKAGTTPVAGVPGQGNDIVFLADTNGGGAVTTSLGQNFRVNSLAFETSTAPATAVTIDGGLTAARLAVAPQSSAQGITMSGTGPTAVTIAAGLDLAAAQTWNVAGSTGVLTISGSLAGSAALAKTGPGTAVLSAAADASFNAAGTGAVTVSGGSLSLTNSAALGSAANAPAVTVAAGGAFYTNAASTTTPVPLVLAGGTLSVGTATQTYSGGVSVTAESTINMRDSASATTTTTARNLNLSGPISGGSRIVLDSNDTVSNGNQLSGQLTLSGDNSSWSGGLRLLRGTVSFTNPAAFGTGGIVADRGRVYFQAPGGTPYTSGNNWTLDAPGGVLEIQPDSTTSADLNVTMSGVVTLGSASNANMALRLFLNDNYSGLDFTGPVVLGNNASISVGGGTRLPAVISGVISETGGPRVLTINDDLGGWNTTNRTLQLTNANTYTGGTNLASGTLLLGNKDALGTGGLSVTVDSILQASVNLTPAGVGALPNDVALVAGLTVSGNNSLALAGQVTNSGGNRTLTNSLPAAATLALGSPVNLSEVTGTGRTLTVAGTGTTEITGGVRNFAGGAGTAGGLTKTGTGTLRLGGSNSYTGLTTVDNGRLELTTAQSLTGALQFGSGDNVATAGTLDIGSVDATFGQLVVQTNSDTSTPTLTIPTGRTLTLAGNVRIGTNRGASTSTRFSATGGGALVVNNPAASGSFAVGGTTNGTGQGNEAVADLSGLSSLAVTLNSSSGTFRVNPSSGSNVTGKDSVLTLPDAGVATTTITANVLAVGDGGQNNEGSGGQLNQLRLGRGTATFNVNTVNIGTGARDIGSISFQGGGGGIVMRAADGVGAAAFNMGTGSATTGVTAFGNVFDVRGHQADLKLGAVAIGTQAARASNLTSLFAFDTGTLEIGTLVASTRGANTVTTTTTIEIGGGTVTSGAWTLATNSGPGTAIATANLTGGTLTFSGGISRGASTGTGPATGTVNLAGAALDMGGHAIGDATNAIVLNAMSGTLRNVAQFNGGATFAKSGSGILTLAGTNTWTGLTDLQAGEIRAGAAGGLNAASTFAVASGAFLSLAGNSAAVGGLTGTGTVRNAAATGGTLAVAASGSTFSGLIEDGVGGGPLALATSGSGIFTLASANTYTGGTAVNAGRLVATNAAALGSGNVTIASGGVLELDLTPTLGGSAIAMSPGGGLRVASGVAAPLAGLSSLGGWEIDPSPLGLATVGRLLSGTVPAGGTTLTGAWVGPRTPDFYSDILALSGTGAGNPFVLSMTYDSAVESGLLAGLNIGRRNDGSSGPFAPLGAAFQGVGVPWTSAFTTVGQYGVDTASQTVWVVSDTNSEFVIVPEPATLGLSGAAAAVGAAWVLRRRRAGRSRIG